MTLDAVRSVSLPLHARPCTDSEMLTRPLLTVSFDERMLGGPAAGRSAGAVDRLAQRPRVLRNDVELVDDRRVRARGRS